MYNPSRGGVRGGADQFTWESVKNDKHRENYLGHSLMAPVGRWQKGKDLSWYAKERKDKSEASKAEKSELASIKKAEEEAMLIALGHNIVRKSQPLSKEDMQEALKRNTGERDEYERVNGVGASSQRVASLSGVGKNSKQKSEGVQFEGRREQNTDIVEQSERTNDSLDDGRKRNKKKSKKHKKEKKHKRRHKQSDDSDSSESTSKHRTKHKKGESDSDGRKSSKVRSYKKSKYKHKHYSSDQSEHEHHGHREDKKRHKKQSDSVKRRRHDTSESD